MAANTFLALVAAGQKTARPHAVYVREHWFGTWTNVPWLFADSVTWSLAPAIGTAQLAWRAGRGMRQGELKPGVVARLTGIDRWFVKIEWDFSDLGGVTPATQYLRWYGTLEASIDETVGLLIDGKTVVPKSKQKLTCYGLEQLWYRTPLRKSVWSETISGAEHTIDRVIPFNRVNGAGEVEGNRSATRDWKSYCFTDKIGIADELWSTRNIAEYLAAHMGPKGFMDVPQPLFRIDVTARDLLPDWDKPVIDPEGKTLGQVLEEILPRGRMLAWRLAVDDSDPDDTAPTVKLTPYSLLGAAVTTPAGQHLFENPRRVALLTDGVPDFHHAAKESSSQRFDQLIVRGARATSTCTLSKADLTLEAGWPSALETEYEAGFSGDGTYAGLGTHDRQHRNLEVRHRDKLWPVFRRFAIPAAWKQKVKNGLGGGSEELVFPTIPGGDKPYPVCPRDLRMLPTVPMKEGFEYEAIGSVTLRIAPIRISDGPHERLAPMVFFKSPVTERYFHVERIGDGAGLETTDAAGELQFSCRIEVPASDRAILLHCHGRPQHAIAAADFDPLDEDPYAGVWDWQDAIITVALTDDRYCEGKWPSDALAKADVVGCRRELLLEAGEKYRLDYLVNNTVIGIDDAGDLIRASEASWIHDERETLAARARQAYEYYQQSRRAAAITTPRLELALDLRLGDYLESIGEADPQTYGSVVSEITVTIPDGDGAPSLSYTTAFAELDPQTFTA